MENSKPQESVKKKLSKSEIIAALNDLEQGATYAPGSVPAEQAQQFFANLSKIPSKTAMHEGLSAQISRSAVPAAPHNSPATPVTPHIATLAVTAPTPNNSAAADTIIDIADVGEISAKTIYDAIQLVHNKNLGSFEKVVGDLATLRTDVETLKTNFNQTGIETKIDKLHVSTTWKTLINSIIGLAGLGLSGYIAYQSYEDSLK